MKCYNHPNIDAVGLCQKCLKGICRECSVEHSVGIVCRDFCGGGIRSKGKMLLIVLIIAGGLAAAFAVFNSVSTKRQALEEVRRIEKATSLGVAGADQVQKAMLAAIARGDLKEEQFFDENYVQIPGSNPPKYHTQYDHFFDREIQPILDRLLAEGYVVFAVAVDRTGYLPTHNSKFAQPLTGDYEKDRANNRSKRIFNDPIGLAAAQSPAPLVQRYFRDTGEGMADCSVPVQLNGRPWGAIRVGITFK